MFGGKMVVPVNPGEGKVLPNSIRKVRSDWGPNDLPDKPGFFQALKNEYNGFALGRYTAEAKATYGKQSQTLTASTTFWVLPWRLGLTALLALVVLIVILKLYNKMIVKSAMGKTAKK
jgi:hypothetical protein